MEIIKLESIEKYYRTRYEEVHALRGVSLSVNEGEKIVVMGPSGSGKSTLLHVLAFLDNPDSGKRYIFGEDKTQVGDVEAARLRRDMFGFVFQEFNIIPEMTVEENVQLPLKIKKVPLVEQKSYVEKALKAVGLIDKRNRKAYELSGGERQRVAIARAVASDSKVLVMDEPTGNLDEETEKEIVKLILGLNEQGKTLVVVTHSDRLARLIDGKLYHMEDGKLYE